jgi:hypothetical protein
MLLIVAAVGGVLTWHTARMYRRGLRGRGDVAATAIQTLIAATPIVLALAGIDLPGPAYYLFAFTAAGLAAPTLWRARHQIRAGLRGHRDQEGNEPR